MPTVKKQTVKKVAPLSAPKHASVIDRISPVTFDEEDGISVLLYGLSGSGKTTLWATFPGPILAMLRSGGTKPGELRSLNAEQRKKTKTVTLQSSEELRMLVEYQKEEQPYKTLVLDHASGFQDLVLSEILGLDDVPVQKTWGLAKQQEYGQCALQVKESLSKLLSLNCNVVIIAQERDFSKEDAKAEEFDVTPTIGAALMPSITGWLNPACDYVCEMFKRSKTVRNVQTINGKEVEMARKRTGEIEYCLRTGPHEVYMTKFRVPKGHKLPSVIVDPDYDKLMKAIRGS